MFDVAVITPTYNRGNLIAEAVRSVVAQTVLTQGRRIEMAIVDDGSTDDTAGVLAPFLQQYRDPEGPLVLTYQRLEKAGVVAARNHAIAHTTAPLLAILDSDDAWLPTKLQRQMAAFDDPAVGLSHTSFRYIDDQGHFRDDGPQRLNNPCVGWCVPTLLDEFLVLFSSAVLRRSTVEEAARQAPHGQIFDPRWTNAQDYDLVLRCARLAKLAYVPEPLTLYRLHGGHGAMGNLKKAYGFHCRVQMDFTQRYGEAFNLTPDDGRDRARAFLYGRAASLFWQRQLRQCRDLCELATELGLADARFAELAKKASRPAWLYRLKDRVDRLRSPAKPT